MRLCWNKGSLMDVFSFFVRYKGYHKKGTLDFEQRMVKELSELLLRKYQSFLRWCKLYINNYMKEDHRSYRRNCKRLSFPSCKSCVYNCDDLPPYNSSPLSSHIWFSYIHNFIRKQFHSVNGTEISHMKIWREPKSLSARLIPVFKHCEHLCVGIHSGGVRETWRCLKQHTIHKASLLKNPIIIILGYLFRFF